LDYRVVAPPDVEEPVVPLVPELLPVPTEPEPDGIVAVELPEAPIPELVPEVEDGPLEADDEPAGVEIDPVAEPPVDPMPDAVPEALPLAVVPQAASAADTPTANRILIMWLLLSRWLVERLCFTSLQRACRGCIEANHITVNARQNQTCWHVGLARSACR
jgi:hypothetical protein